MEEGAVVGGGLAGAGLEGVGQIGAAARKNTAQLLGRDALRVVNVEIPQKAFMSVLKLDEE